VDAISLDRGYCGPAVHLTLVVIIATLQICDYVILPIAFIFIDPA
jgi:hypothetical protein